MKGETSETTLARKESRTRWRPETSILSSSKALKLRSIWTELRQGKMRFQTKLEPLRTWVRLFGISSKTISKRTSRLRALKIFQSSLTKRTVASPLCFLKTSVWATQTTWLNGLFTRGPLLPKKASTTCQLRSWASQWSLEALLWFTIWT